MTNFDKYKDDKALRTISFGIREDKPVECDSIYNCADCDFYEENCCEARMKWLKAEYKENAINIVIDIPKDTKTDAKIEVSNDGKKWYKRYFSRFRGDYVMVRVDGCTSWNAKGEIPWKYARLPQD